MRTRAQSCLCRSKHNWLSPEIFHELLEMMAHGIFCSLTEEVRKAGHYAVKVDETTDMSAKKQVSISFRVVEANFELQGVVLWFLERSTHKGDQTLPPFSRTHCAVCRLTCAVGNVTNVPQTQGARTMGSKCNRKNAACAPYGPCLQSCVTGLGPQIQV